MPKCCCTPESGANIREIEIRDFFVVYIAEARADAAGPEVNRVLSPGWRGHTLGADSGADAHVRQVQPRKGEPIDQPVRRLTCAGRCEPSMTVFIEGAGS